MFKQKILSIVEKQKMLQKMQLFIQFHTMVPLEPAGVWQLTDEVVLVAEVVVDSEEIGIGHSSLKLFLKNI